ncbi:MAG: D-glycero-beta-D-manno-heptose 1,7-bisphosphate 7-phosphatase [archaeon]
MNKAVFLDRDGVINIDKDYVYKIKDLRLIPGAGNAIKKLQDRGYILIIITNQSGIGRGYYSESQYLFLKDSLHKRLARYGVKISAEYYCPHLPEKNCRCRKPGTLNIEKAIEKFDIDVKKSYFIGDKTSDILAGKNSGLKTILVKTGKAGKDSLHEVQPDFTCDSIKDVLGVIS